MAVAMLVATLASLTLLTVGLMGLLGRLPRNHFAGIRTRATLASDEAWEDAHRAGGAPLIFAAVAAFMAGLAFLPFVLADKVGDALALTIVIVQAVVVGVGVVVSWILGEKAAKAALPSPSAPGEGAGQQ